MAGSFTQLFAQFCLLFTVNSWGICRQQPHSHDKGQEEGGGGAPEGRGAGLGVASTESGLPE